LSEDEALRELEEEDKAREISKGAGGEVNRAMSAPAVIALGMSLEDDQYVRHFLP